MFPKMSRFLYGLAFLVLTAAIPLGAQSIIRTFAGADWLFQGDGKRAPEAPIGNILTVIVGPRNEIYFADPGNDMVMKVSADGILTVVAGNGITGYSGDGGPATRASLNLPTSIAFDSAGILYIADNNNVRIRRVSSSGIISTYAGTGRAGFGGDGGPANQATFFSDLPNVAVDRNGNLYVVDRFNQRIRRIDRNGVITTVAGNGRSEYSGDGGPATQAGFNFPSGVAVDDAGNLYITDRLNHRIRRVTLDGRISTYAGTGVAGFGGDGGAATSARLNSPFNVGPDAAGNVYIADSVNNSVRRVNPQGIITTVAGNQRFAFSGDGGTALQASLTLPRSVAPDAAGGFYIADELAGRVRRVSPEGIITTVAGNGLIRSFSDGIAATQAYLNNPRGIWLAPDGRLYIADTENHYLRVVDTSGRISTLAGRGGGAFTGDGGPARNAYIANPADVVGDSAGNLYFSDSGTNRIRRIAPNGIINTIAGNGLPGYNGDGNPATRFSLQFPQEISLDRAGNLYIADRNNHRIRRLSPDSTISTVAGTGAEGYTGDGGPATLATLRFPWGVTVDSQNNLYIADRDNHVIRRVAANGIISTIMGNGRSGFAGDNGPAASSQLSFPRRVVLAPDGVLLVVDAGNQRLRRIDASGVITTIAGTGANRFAGDGGLATAAALGFPSDAAVDSSGSIYVADNDNHRIRVISRVQASVQVSPDSLTFTARSNGPVTAPRTVRVAGSLAGLPFTLRISDGDWLRVSPRRGVVPAALELSADPTRLTPGSYRATLTIEAPLATPPAQNVSVTFGIEQPDPPRLALDASGLAFAFIQRAPAESRGLRVLNRGSGSLNFTANATTASGGNWLSVGPQTGTATAATAGFVTVTASPGSLGAGAYSGRVIVSADTGGLLSVPVTMTISSVPQSILLSQTGLTFIAVAGGGAPAAQGVDILNVGQGALNWSAATSTFSGGSGWLAVSPASGSSNAASPGSPVEVRVNGAGLGAGEYYGQLQVSAPSANNTPQIVLVVLNVLPAGSNPGPVVQPTGLLFTGVAGGLSPGSQTVTVSNVTASPVTFASGRVTVDGGAWFVHAPSDATVAPDAPIRVVVQPDLTGLDAGVRRGALTLVFADGSIRPVSLLLVTAPAGSRINQNVITQAGCAPTQLLPVFTLLGEQFNVPAGWPSPIEVRVTDDCGNAMRAGSVVASFSNGDPPLNLSPLLDGRWSGTWQPRNSSVPQVTVAVQAQMLEQRLSGAAQVTGGLRAGATPPAVGAGAVVSAASFAPQAPLAPGSFVSIFGSRLAERLAVSSSLPLENSLAGTVVTVAGRALPLLFASDGQINAQIPYGIPVNTRHQLVVRRGSAVALPESITVAETQPAIFTKNQSGRGQGVILDTSFRYAEPGNAVQAGDVIIIYCSGLGAVDPPVEAGTAAPGSPLSGVKNFVTLTIGGVEAQVFFGGLAPGFAGLYQVNAFVPGGVEPGDEAPVVLSSAGQSSAPVTMAVR